MPTTQPNAQYSVKNNVSIHVIETFMPNLSFHFHFVSCFVFIFGFFRVLYNSIIYLKSVSSNINQIYNSKLSFISQITKIKVKFSLVHRPKFSILAKSEISETHFHRSGFFGLSTSITLDQKNDIYIA